MKLVNAEINRMDFVLGAEPRGFVTVDICLELYKEDTDTSNNMTFRVRVDATEDSTVLEIRRAAIHEALEALRLSIEALSGGLGAFPSKIWRPD